MYTIAPNPEPFRIAVEGGSEVTQGRAVELWQIPELRLFLHYRGSEFCLTESRTGRLLAKDYTELLLWGAVEHLLRKYTSAKLLAKIAQYPSCNS